MKKGLIGSLIIIILLVLILFGLFYIWKVYNFSFSTLRGAVVTVDFNESNVLVKDYSFSDFKSIRIEGNGKLILTQDNNYSLKIEAEDRILKMLDVRIEQDTLVIGRKGVIFLSSKPINIYITTPEINEITFTGTGDIQTKNQIKTDQLNISIFGTSNGNIFLDTRQLNTKISGFGTLNYQGTTESHNIIISGIGSINSLGLISKNTDISISGSGDAKIYSTEELNIKISGSGKVSYKGDPKVSQSISGLGNIEKIS